MSHTREKAATCVAMLQAAINLMEQVSVEGGGIREKAGVERDHRIVTKTLERMQQKYLRVYTLAASERSA